MSIGFSATENMERSNLYLKLFKLVFGSVTMFAQENELMLKVYIHVQILHIIIFLASYTSSVI